MGGRWTSVDGHLLGLASTVFRIGRIARSGWTIGFEGTVKRFNLPADRQGAADWLESGNGATGLSYVFGDQAQRSFSRALVLRRHAG